MALTMMKPTTPMTFKSSNPLQVQELVHLIVPNQGACLPVEPTKKSGLVSLFLNRVNPGLFFVYFRHFLIPITISTLQIEKA